MNEGLRNLVIARAEGCCEYCHVPQGFDPIPFEVDHVIALKHRGKTESVNLALACFSCNNFKGPNIAGVDPISGTVVPLFHPRDDAWSEHFEWHAKMLAGKTPIGRATIEVLEINLPYRCAFRRELMNEGVFPPD